MPMTLIISLPTSLKKLIDNRIKDGNYGSASEYLRALVRADVKRRDERELEKLLLEGLSSGTNIEVTEAYKREVLRKFEDRRRKRKANVTSSTRTSRRKAG